jgi:hypothetical protein
MRKKGMQMDLLTGLIIAIIIFILLFIFASAMNAYMSNKVTVETCRASVIGATQLGKGSALGLVTPFEWELECPQDAVIISEEEYKVNELERPYRHDGWEENVKQVFADQMAACWYKFGEGKLDAFDDDAFVGTNNVCFTCSHIQFQGAELSQVTGLEQFLTSENMINAFAQTDGMTFWDYLYVENIWDGKKIGSILFSKDADNTIYTKKEYSIVFHVVNWKLEPGLLGVGVEEVFDYELGTDEDAYFLHVGPTEFTGANCDYWYE